MVDAASAEDHSLPLLRLLLGHGLGLYLVVEAAFAEDEVAGALAEGGVGSGVVREAVEGFVESRGVYGGEMDGSEVNEAAVELAEGWVRRRR